jgi:hydrogenase expression/formation protein HypE
MMTDIIDNLSQAVSENSQTMPSGIILLDHGSGGKISHDLISGLLLPKFANPALALLNDGAVFRVGREKFAFSTDTYVVDPLFFPGGSIGDLAVNGTINDIAMCGAVPLYLSAGFIIEEGFSITTLTEIIDDMAAAAQNADVQIVTGDTKVVPKGAVDKIFINTSGVGTIAADIEISGHNARPGDKIILSGTIADHGITVLTQREGLTFNTNVKSDTAPLHRMVSEMLFICPEIRVLRDPTRGGVGTTLNEIAISSDVGIKIYEDQIPIKSEVAGVCELLGLDPLYVANEGKLLAFVAADEAQAVLAAVRKNNYGKDAVIIGEVVSRFPKKVFMQTKIGGSRIVDMLTGEQLPRIC